MKAILLCRVSDESQKEGYSLDAQLNRLQYYAASRGLQVTDDLIFSFDETAHKEKRKKFDEVVKVLSRSREPMALVCDKVDRLARTMTVQILEIDRLRAEGKLELHFASESLVLHKDSPAGDLFRFGLFVQLAKFYSDSIRDNIKRSYEEAIIRRGIWIGLAPIGYKNIFDNDKNRKWIILDPERADFIREIFTLYATGEWTMRAIAEKVNRDGMRTRQGFKLTFKQIDRILSNPFYAGRMQWHGEEFPHQYEKLVPHHVFEKIRNVQRRNHRVKSGFALTGLVRCGHCDYLMTPYQQKTYVYLKCSNCGKSHLSERKVLERVASQLGRLKLSEQQIVAIAERLEREVNRHINTQIERRQTMEKRQREIEVRIDNLTNMRIAGEIDSALYTAKLAELKQMLYDVTNNLIHEGHVMKKAVSISEIIKAITIVSESTRAIFLSANDVNKARFLKQVISTLTIKGGEVMSNFKPPLSSLMEVNTGPGMPGLVDLTSQASNFLRDADSLVSLAQTLSKLQASVAEGASDGRLD